MIDSSQITVVIQGPISEAPRTPENGCTTDECIQSIRQHLPKATIIISTWEGADCSGLDYDSVIYSHDPGPINPYIVGPWSAHNNLNRQIISTANGLKKVATTFTLKFRGDHRLLGSDFTCQFETNDSNTSGSCLESKIVASTWHTIDTTLYPSPYRVSDLFQFGRTSDLLKYWDAPLASDPLREPNPTSNNGWLRFYGIPFIKILTYAPEQYLFISFLQRAGYPLPSNKPIYSDNSFWQKSAQALYDHFIIRDPIDLNIEHPKRMADKPALYTTSSFEYNRSLQEVAHYLPRFSKLLSASFLSMTYPDKPLLIRLAAVLLRNPKKVGKLLKEHRQFREAMRHA